MATEAAVGENGFDVEIEVHTLGEPLGDFAGNVAGVALAGSEERHADGEKDDQIAKHTRTKCRAGQGEHSCWKFAFLREQSDRVRRGLGV